MSVNELMTYLADAVRHKTGKSEKMTLEEIAAAINGITVSGDIGFTYGIFTAADTGSAEEIEHGLGQVPGAVLFLKMSSANTTLSSSSSSTTVTDSLFSLIYGVDSGHTYCYCSTRRTSSSSSSSTVTTNRYWSHVSTTPSSVFGSGNTAASFNVTNINEVSFTTPRQLHASRSYLWIAFRASLK